MCVGGGGGMFQLGYKIFSAIASAVGMKPPYGLNVFEK